MEPIQFKEANLVLAENQPEYLPLPVYVNLDDHTGTMVCCWKLTWKERLIMLFKGKLFISTMTFGSAFQPILPQINKPCMEENENV